MENPTTNILLSTNCIILIFRKHPHITVNTKLKADGTITAAYILLITKGIRIVRMREIIANMVIIFD